MRTIFPDGARPPRIGWLLMRLARLGNRRAEVEADLLELFALRATRDGHRVARWRFVTDALSVSTWRQAHLPAAPRQFSGGVHAMLQDLVFTARLFRRQPGLFGITVIGLAVAIGISTAVFSIAHTLLFRDYGIAAPESVARVALGSGPFSSTGGSSIYRGNWAFSDYVRLRDASSSLDVVASARDSADYRADPSGGEPVPVTVLAVSGGYFPVLGLRAARGRTLTSKDDEAGSRAVVISQGFWKSNLGSDPSVIGRTIWLRFARASQELPFVVAGVADRAHGVPSYDGPPPAFWMTLATHADAWSTTAQASAVEARAALEALKRRSTGDPSEQARVKAFEQDLAAPVPRWNPAVDVLGRTRPGISRPHAEAEAGAIAVALATEQGRGDVVQRLGVKLESLDDSRGDSRTVTTLLTITIGFVIFLACANVTNLLLASAAARRREIGTRLAIGASRGRIMRQLLTESLLLGLLGGILGLLLAIAILPTFAALVQVPSSLDVSPDLTVYGFVGLLTVAVGLIAGLAPARYGRRGDLVSALTSDQLAAPRPLPRSVLRSMLIGGQATASVVLLVLAALLTRALVQTTRIDLGFDAARVVNVTVGTRTNGPAWSAARREAYWTAALERVRQLPGVAGAALVGAPPFGGITSPQQLDGRVVNRNETSPDYFSALGMRVVRGRVYTPEEGRVEAPVAVISERLARQYWGSEDPIGGTLERVWGPDNVPGRFATGPQRKPKGARVIGVVSDVVTDLRSLGAPTIYLPLTSTSHPRLVVRTHDDPHRIVRDLRDTLQALDPSVGATTAFTLSGLERDLALPRMLALLSTIVGTTALGLAVIGLFGVTAFVVEQRRHEVSVRKALGANNRQLMQMLFRDSLTPVAAGLACGLLLSLLGGRVIQGVLYGVSSRDPIAILTAVVVLVAAACAAVFIPARRAARVNPAQLLKQG